MSRGSPGSSWLFVTSHTLALLLLARNPVSSAREVAQAIGITQRHAQRVLADLVSEGYVAKTRAGRGNRYEIERDAPLRHSEVAARTVGELLDLLVGGRAAAGAARGS